MFVTNENRRKRKRIIIDDEKQNTISEVFEDIKDNSKIIPEDSIDNGINAAARLFETLLSSTNVAQEEQVSLAAKKRKRKKR